MREIQKYIMDTISIKKKRLLKPEDLTWDWLIKLKECTEPDSSTMKTKAHNKYLEALKGLKQGKVNQWLDHWEDALQLVEKYKLPQTENGLWLLDLATAIKPLSDTLHHRYKKRSKHPQKQEFLNYHKVISEVRDAFNEAPKKTSNIIARGSAFNTEFAGEPEEGDTPSDAAPAPKRKRAATNSTDKDKPPSKKINRYRCPACDLRGHKLENCWYVLEHLRPDDFTYAEDYMNKIRKKIEEDKKLAAKIEKLKLTEGDDD